MISQVTCFMYLYCAAYLSPVILPCVGVSFCQDGLAQPQCEELGHLLLLCVKRSQLRCLLHLIRIPPGHRPLEVFWACPTWRPAGQITHLQPRNALRSIRRNLNALLARQMFRVPCLVCCCHDSTLDKQKLMP